MKEKVLEVAPVSGFLILLILSVIVLPLVISLVPVIVMISVTKLAEQERVKEAVEAEHELEIRVTSDGKVTSSLPLLLADGILLLGLFIVSTYYCVAPT